MTSPLPKRAKTAEEVGEDRLALAGPISAVFPRLVFLFAEHVKAKYDLADKNIQRLQWMLEYNILGGKCYRGLLVMSTAKELANDRGLDWAALEERAAVLAWCVEILQACFLVADDLMDASETRRGQPCWYQQPEVKLVAVNDSLILESFIYWLLKEYFGTDPKAYLALMELYHEVSMDTEIGQMLDLTAAPQGRREPELLNNFDSAMYTQIVQYKTACYTFYLPLASALILCDAAEAGVLPRVRSICMAMGEKFQIQDDYLDCYGDPEQIGKIGTDIQDFKCSWLLVQALQLVTPEQRAVIEQNYGQSNPHCIEKVKALYRSLDLEAIYQKQEQESFERLVTSIDAAAKEGLPAYLFMPILKKIHGREK